MTHADSRYLFLMRHAEHQEGHLTEDATEYLRSVAGRFAEWLLTEWRDDDSRTIRLWRTTGEAEVVESAEHFTRHVITKVIKAKQTLGPYPFARRTTASLDWMPKPLPKGATKKDPAVVLAAYSPSEHDFRKLVKWLRSDRACPSSARRTGMDAPLLVGNDPLIGWLATKLTRRPTPVARGELVCLIQRSSGARWELLWTISADREPEADAIRAKIKSKMTTAGALGTVIVGLTTFLLQRPPTEPLSLWQWLAVAALGMSAGLYFAALFLYDTLQMPSRFWASRFSRRPRASGKRGVWTRLRHGMPCVQRPPSSSARVLQASMMRVWTCIFKPATTLAGLGVAFFAVSKTFGAAGTIAPWWLVTPIGVGLALLVGIWVAWHRPDLGASD